MLTQEKLSHYLDLVEINLLKQIYSRSDAFFGALENIQVSLSRIFAVYRNFRFSTLPEN